MASRLSLNLAHPIAVPEPGCVLVATEKLDGVRTFERSVVLFLRSGVTEREEGPFGIVINRLLHKKMKPTNPDIAATFSDCSLTPGVVSGLCFGSLNCLEEAVGLVKKGILQPRDFRFFAGYAGWQLEQLREEIELDYWDVAACSSNLICGMWLWEERFCRSWEARNPFRIC